jgi:hypothetical protein
MRNNWRATNLKGLQTESGTAAKAGREDRSSLYAVFAGWAPKWELLHRKGPREFSQALRSDLRGRHQ